MGAGSGGWEGPGCFFPNVRPQPKISIFNQLLWNEEGGQGCWDTRGRGGYCRSLLLSCILSRRQRPWHKKSRVLELEGPTVDVSSAAPQPGPWIQGLSPLSTFSQGSSPFYLFPIVRSYARFCEKHSTAEKCTILKSIDSVQASLVAQLVKNPPAIQETQV